MKILKFLEKNRKIEISKFPFFIDFFIDFFPENVLVSKNIFRFLIEFFFDQNFSRLFFFGPKFLKNVFRSNFFGQTFFDEKNFDHIFRFKKSQRFQKSHLENCAMRPGTPSRGKNGPVCHQYGCNPHATRGWHHGWRPAISGTPVRDRGR